MLSLSTQLGKAFKNQVLSKGPDSGNSRARKAAREVCTGDKDLEGKRKNIRCHRETPRLM